MPDISTCLWFDTQAEDAAKFYTSVFKNSKIEKVAHYGKAGAAVSGQKEGSVMTVDFVIEGQKIMGLNGGPQFKFTPALSFFVWCDSENEIDELWRKLGEGGEVRMGLDKYPWSPKYGWTTDRYGVEWQLMLGGPKWRQKIAPALLFVKDVFGKGEEAIGFYTSLFKNSKIESIARDEASKTVMHAVFSLDGQNFALMEGPGTHDFTFSLAFSFVVNCQTQEEIDTYWQKLAAGGSTEQCGWLKDKYGVSWQVVPAVMADLMTDPRKSENVMSAMLKMKKLDIKKLKEAAAS